MSVWRLTPDPEDDRKDRWKRLPTPAMAGVMGPEGYKAQPELVDAINVALALGQPLFVTGEPGCGKTELGDYVAWKLGLGRAISFETKSTMTSRELFYQFDTVGRFHAAQSGGAAIEPVNFISYQALGLAILCANEPDDIAHLVPPDFEHPGKRRSVVLIDEIDKAPRDVPNDLLSEIENMRFRVPELGETVEADQSLRPIVVISSNSEKALPDAFLRRCVYYDIPFPEDEILQEIVASRIADLPVDSDLLGDAIRILRIFRQPRRHLRKRPGTAELLGFLLELRDRGYEAGDRLQGREDWRDAARGTLFKTSEDQRAGMSVLSQFDWSEER